MASGDSLLVLPAQANEPPSANYATLDIRNGHPCLDFDDTTDESAVFSGVLPTHYGGGGITVYLHVALLTAVANNMKWEAAFERVGDGQQDIDADGFAAAQNSGDVAVPGTSGFVKIVAITFTNGAQMDSVAVGEEFRLKVTSKVPTGTKATGDRQLCKVHLKET